MKMKQYIKGAVLALAAVSTVGLYVPNAHAIWSATGATIPVVAQGLNSLAAKTAAATTGNAIYTSVAGESLATNDTITITLTGGLTYNGSALMTLTPSAGDIGGGAATAAVPLSGGLAGSTSATWRVITPVAATSTLTLNSLTVAIFDVTGIPAAGNADILLSLATGTGQVIGAANRSNNTDIGNYPFAGINLTTVTGTNSPTDTAQVVQLFRFFNAAGTTVTGTSVTGITTNNASGASLPTGALAANKELYTLTGNFNGITSVTVNAGIVTGDDGTGAAAGVVNEFTINAGKTAAMAVNTAAIAAAGNDAITALAFVIDGTTSQAARSFTLALDVLADATWSAHSVQAATTTYTIARNGFSFTTTQTGMGSTNIINVRDRSNTLPAAGADIIVVVTTYDAATGTGTTTVPVTLTSKLNNLSQTSVTSADIIADALTAGVTIPTGVAASVFFTVNTSNGTASVKKQVAGVGLDIGSTATSGTVLK